MLRRIKHVVIVGAGVGGLSAAHHLARLGVQRITVYEKRKKSEYEKYNSKIALGIWPYAVEGLLHLGIDVTPYVSKMPRGGFCSSYSGNWIARQKANTAASPLFIRQNKFLDLLLAPIVNKTIVDHTTPTNTNNITNNNINNTDNNINNNKCNKYSGQVHVYFGVDVVDYKVTKTTADFLVIADGGRSKIRKELLPTSEVHPVGYVVFRGITSLNTNNNNNNIIIDAFEPFQAWLGRDYCRFAVVPLGNEYGWFATVRSDTKSIKMLTENNKKQKQYLQKTFEGWRKPIAQLIEATREEDILSEEALDINIYEDNWMNDHCVLVGDAAHVMDPILAQGASLALYDAYDLASALANTTQEPNWGYAYTISASRRANHVRQISNFTTFASHQPVIINLAKISPRIFTESSFEFFLRRSLPESPPHNLFDQVQPTNQAL